MGTKWVPSLFSDQELENAFRYYTNADKQQRQPAKVDIKAQGDSVLYDDPSNVDDKEDTVNESNAALDEHKQELEVVIC